MKKIFTLFAALAMVMSMSAATTRIYCKNTQNWWKADGAAVGAHYWGTAGDGTSWPGTRMTKVSGETDLWYIDIDVSKYQNIIFTRVNASGTVSDWGAKTADLTVPTDGKNLYTITSTSPVWGNPGVTGTWSKYVTTVTVTIQAENGTVTGLAAGGTYDSGSTATLTAVPNDGYEFVNWTVGGKEVSTANPYTFTVNDNITLVANFKEAAAKTYTITTSATNGTVEGAATVVEGESVTLTATANPGYKFVNWTVGGVEVSTDNPYIFIPTEDATVVANFEQLPPETVYFVNVADWTGTINIHAWGGTAPGTEWPGNPADKEDYQIGGHDVYSLTADAGAYANVIFNNGGTQTSDLVWTAGKYYVVDEWLTKEEAEEKLASGDPLGLTYNVTVPAGTYACYIAGEMSGWSQQEMTKVDDTHYTITIVDATTAMKYKYCSGPAWDYAEIKADGTAVADRTYSENDVVAKWAKVYNPNPTVDPEPDPTYDYYITGTLAGGWDPKQQGLEKDGEFYKATFTELNAGEYEFKITAGDWEHQWNYSNLGAAYEEVSQGVDNEGNPNGNIKIVTEEAKNITVIFDAIAGKITLEGLTEKVVPTYDYYITGTLAGGWDPKQQGLEKDGEFYKATFTELNAGEYEFKITAGDWEHQWNYSNLGAAYEEVSQGVDNEGNPNGNIKIVTEEAKNITVIFDAIAGKITLEGLTEKVVVISYVLMGVGSDWTTGIALTKNETAEYGEEYVLLDQEILEGDAVKVVTLINGVPTYYCGAVEIVSPVKFEFDENGNIVLLPGKYDFYFKVNDPTTYEDDAMYITGEAYPEVPTAIDNVDTAVAPAKAIVNGQLVIVKDGVKYNAQGAVVK